MDILFNRNGNGSKELRDATGSYYANNDFAKIRTDVELATDAMTKLVGGDVMARALAHYASTDYLLPEPTAEQKRNDQLVRFLQVPIAYHATFRYYQTNLVGHEDSGRKVKIDNQNERMPWEWMLDRDDAAQMRKANETTDRLIWWLEDNRIAEWMNSENRRATRSLFVHTAALFQDAYPIDLSPRFFYTVLPFNREVQQVKIKKAIGTYYQQLLNYHQAVTAEGSGSGSSGGGIPGEDDAFLSELLLLVQKVIPLLTMVMAVRRLNLQAMPDGVVQHFKSMQAARGSSQPALQEVVNAYISSLEKDANYLLDDIKILIQSADPEAGEYPLAAKNRDCYKYFRT